MENVYLKFGKRFVSGSLQGLTADGGFKIVESQAASELARFQDFIAQETILGLPGCGSKYVVTSVEIVKGGLLWK